MPLGQAVHVVEDDAPTADEKYPGLHIVHPETDERADVSPNVPAGQSLQEEEAFADALYVPAAHAEQTPSREAEKYPPTHAVGAFAGFRHE